MSSIRTISRIEPAQFALILGVTYALLGILFGVLFFVFSSFIPSSAGFPGMSGGFMIIMFPIMYGIFGYIGGFIGALIYNMVAGTVGGVKVTVTD
jgi:ABC-type antimicrobial peptide transport system permease subunit